jgi:hypothetical protein
VPLSASEQSGWAYIEINVDTRRYRIGNSSIAVTTMVTYNAA